MPLKKIIPAVWLRWIAAVFIVLFFLSGVKTASAAPCDIKSFASSLIQHDLSESYCELCSYGYVTIIITNSYEGVDMVNMSVVEDLRSSGLTFASTAPNRVTYSVNGGAAQPGGAPSISGSTLTWTAAQIPALGRLAYNQHPWRVNTLAITFAVTRTSNPEGLVSADRRIVAGLTYSTDPACFSGTRTVSTGLNLLPLREPIPAVTKRGRNVDAAQSSSQYSQIVYGNNNDDVIWRIRVGNTGLAALQDLRLDDYMQPGNLAISYICPTEAAATAIATANGAGPGSQGCQPAQNWIDNFDVDNPFGTPGNDSPDLVDVPANGYTYIYLVGKVPQSGSCSPNRNNTVSDIQWGCEAQPPAGGITTTSTGYTPSNASATLSTRSVNTDANLIIQTEIVGTNTAQPAGSKGTVRITITNRTGGTIKGINLRNVLPPEYVVDPTFTPAVAMTPAYGTYSGMTNRIE